MGEKEVTKDYRKPTDGKEIYRIIKSYASRFYFLHNHILPSYISLEDFIQDVALNFLEIKNVPNIKFVCHHILDKYYPRGISRKIYDKFADKPIDIEYEDVCDAICIDKYLNQEDCYDLNIILNKLDNINPAFRDNFIETVIKGKKPRDYAKEINVSEISVRKRNLFVIKKIRKKMNINK